MHDGAHGAGGLGAREPRVEVDEDGADELPGLERGVAGHLRVADVELDDLGRAGLADEGVDDEPGVVPRLDVWGQRCI